MQGLGLLTHRKEGQVPKSQQGCSEAGFSPQAWEFPSFGHALGSCSQERGRGWQVASQSSAASSPPGEAAAPSRLRARCQVPARAGSLRADNGTAPYPRTCPQIPAQTACAQLFPPLPGSWLRGGPGSSAGQAPCRCTGALPEELDPSRHRHHLSFALAHTPPTRILSACLPAPSVVLQSSRCCMAYWLPLLPSPPSWCPLGHSMRGPELWTSVRHVSAALVSTDVGQSCRKSRVYL